MLHAHTKSVKTQNDPNKHVTHSITRFPWYKAYVLKIIVTIETRICLYNMNMHT